MQFVWVNRAARRRGKTKGIFIESQFRGNFIFTAKASFLRIWPLFENLNSENFPSFSFETMDTHTLHP